MVSQQTILVRPKKNSIRELEKLPLWTKLDDFRLESMIPLFNYSKQFVCLFTFNYLIEFRELLQKRVKLFSLEFNQTEGILNLPRGLNLLRALKQCRDQFLKVRLIALCQTHRLKDSNLGKEYSFGVAQKSHFLLYCKPKTYKI